jgi:hypothetical protein
MFGISYMATDIFCFYLQTSQTGVQQYSDTSPFSIPWLNAILFDVVVPQVQHKTILEFFLKENAKNVDATIN